VISKFISEAKEIEMDAVADCGEVVVYAISEHVENAGVHSGDATLVLPAQNLYVETMRRIKHITRAIARSLNITGPFNIQYLAKENAIKVIECNLRSSRTFPFVSTTFNINFIEVATKIVMGIKIRPTTAHIVDMEYVAIKAPQFSFTRLHGADPILGVEMASTGEVACFGEDKFEAFLKALMSTGFKIPRKNIYISFANPVSKALFLESAQKLIKMGYRLFGSAGTTEYMQGQGVKIEVLHYDVDNLKPTISDYMKKLTIEDGRIELVINVPDNTLKKTVTNGYLVRRQAADSQIGLITNMKCAKLLVDSLERVKKFGIKSLDEIVEKI